MTVGYFSKEETLIAVEIVEFNSAILGHYQQVFVIVGELERLNNCSYHNLMLNQK